MNVNEQIKELLKSYFGTDTDSSKAEIYRTIGEKLGVHPERVRKHHRMMKAKESFNGFISTVGEEYPTGTHTVSQTMTDNNTGVFTSQVESDYNPKNNVEIAELHHVNLSNYKIDRYWSSQKANGKFLTSVSASPINKEDDVEFNKSILIDEVKKYSPQIGAYKRTAKPGKKNLLEIALFDVHFGKLAHEEESGSDYDLKIAGKRYRDAIFDLIGNVNMAEVERILFPIGNDMFNVDNINKTTTNFTPQDTDTRFHKMVKFVKTLLIETIDFLSQFAPVDVVVVQGNHDQTISFMCGEILDAFYHNNKNINVDNGPTLRKYYQYGVNSFLFTHGDKEKQNELGMIFAAEKPTLWADTNYRYIQLGHFHHNKKISFLSHNEFQGFQIQILPSLSPNDAWHTGKGYSALRQGKAFIYNKYNGLIAEFTHTVR